LVGELDNSGLCQLEPELLDNKLGKGRGAFPVKILIALSTDILVWRGYLCFINYMYEERGDRDKCIKDMDKKRKRERKKRLQEKKKKKKK
jgi:hypothetical protein